MPADGPSEAWSQGGRTRIGVVGAGVMGAEIALIAAQSGFLVTIRDIDAAAVDRGLAHAQTVGQRQVAKGRVTADDLAAALARIVPATDDDDLAGCAIVIEAVTESMEVKRALFERLDAALPRTALIASNTSGLSITALAAATGRPERVLGLHFFNPPTVMRLVEVVRGERTSPETADAGIALARAMGKTPVVVAECPGFLVNRVLVRAMVAAYRHAQARGTDPGAVDAAVVESGPAPMGPFALGDLIGLDTLASIAARPPVGLRRALLGRRGACAPRRRGPAGAQVGRRLPRRGLGAGPGGRLRARGGPRLLRRGGGRGAAMPGRGGRGARRHRHRAPARSRVEPGAADVGGSPLRSPGRIAAQGVALVRVVREARREYGAGAVATARRVRRLRRRQGYLYDEALAAGALDPALGEPDLMGFVSDHENHAAQRRLNGGDSPALTHDKGVLYLYLRALGLRAPELLGIIHQVGDGWIRPDLVIPTRGAFEEALTGLPPEIVVKPTLGFGGAGVRVLVRRDGVLIDPPGRRLTPGALWDALRSDTEYDCHVIQERIRNHHLIAQLGGGDETLHTVRIVTLIDRDGSVHVLWATLKLGISGSGVDNLAHGTTGNISCAVDLEDGRIGGVLTPRANGYGQALSAPPADEGGLPYHVPFWREARSLACAGARHFRPLRTLGWDIAIAPEGPVIIEANANWGMEPTPRMGAVLARMRAA